MKQYKKRMITYIFDCEKEKEAKELRSELQNNYKYVDLYTSIGEIRVVASNQE
jgi:hypothetical protein